MISPELSHSLFANCHLSPLFAVVITHNLFKVTEKPLCVILSQQKQELELARTMLGMGSLTLSSPTTMVAQTTLTSSKRHIVSNRTHSLPMSLVSPTNQNFTLLSSFKKQKPFITAVASVQSDNVSSSDAPATQVSFSLIYVLCLLFFFLLNFLFQMILQYNIYLLL